MSGNHFFVDSSLGFQAPRDDLGGLMNCVRYNEEGDIELVKEYLCQHPEAIDTQDEQGRTLMHMAAANGYVDVLEVLLSFHPTPNIQNTEGNTALHFAALNKCVSTASLLLDGGWKTDIVNSAGQTALQLISQQRGFEEVENFLLSYDDSVDVEENELNYLEPSNNSEGHEVDDVPSLYEIEKQIAKSDVEMDDEGTKLQTASSECRFPSKKGSVSPFVEEEKHEQVFFARKSLAKGAFLGSANMEEVE